VPVRKNIPFKSGLYFITFTCSNWLSLFQIADAYSSVYNWFNYLKNQGHYIIGFTIMPNHVHLIIAFKETEISLNTIIANGKRFIAYDIIKKLTNQKRGDILEILSNGRNATEIKNGKLHKVFETSFDWKWLNSNKLVEQKLNYIHLNPCKGKWNLANSPIEYGHSSAKYYLTGLQGDYKVTNFNEMNDLSLID
jgi:REP element-mobilizing transposase RayT